MCEPARRVRSTTVPARRYSTSCLDDAAFRELYAYQVASAIGKATQHVEYYMGFRHLYPPPPSSPTEAINSSPVPLIELSQGPYGSNWQTLSQPVEDLATELPSSPQQATPGRPNATTARSHPKLNRRRIRGRRDNDPLRAARNTETFRRRRNRTLVEYERIEGRPGNDTEAHGALFGTTPPASCDVLVRNTAALSLRTTSDKSMPLTRQGEAGQNADSVSDEETNDEENGERIDYSDEERGNGAEQVEEEDDYYYYDDADSCDDVLSVLDGYDDLAYFEDEEGLRADWDPFWPSNQRRRV